MKILGMIGGTSWHSTIEYYRLINEQVGAQIGTYTNPPLMIYSLNIALMREGNKEKINKKYLEVASTLQEAGAEAIIICANTPHMVYPYLAPKIKIPILHIADATGSKANELGLKTLGLLGNKPTMKGDFIQSHLLQNYSIQTIIPKDEYLDKSHYFVSKELTQGIFSQDAKSFFLNQLELFKERGADGVILGCTELPLLINQEDFDFPMLATTHLHTQMAVQFILS